MLICLQASVATDNHFQVFRYLLQLLLDVLLSLVVDLVVEFANLPLNASSVLDQIYQLAEFRVQGDEQLVSFLRVFVFLGGLKGRKKKLLRNVLTKEISKIFTSNITIRFPNSHYSKSNPR